MDPDDNLVGRKERKVGEKREKLARIAWRAACCLILFGCGVYLGLTALRRPEPAGHVAAPGSDDTPAVITNTSNPAPTRSQETAGLPVEPAITVTTPPQGQSTAGEAIAGETPSETKETGSVTGPDEAAPAFVMGAGFQDLVWPCQGRISKEPGWYFVEDLGEWRYMPGVLIEGEWGRKVLAALRGTVVSVTTDPAWGNTITLDHGGGLLTGYGGVGTVARQIGDSVLQGDTLGSLAGTDLLFSTFANDEPHNPKDYLTRTR